MSYNKDVTKWFYKMTIFTKDVVIAEKGGGLKAANERQVKAEEQLFSDLKTLNDTNSRIYYGWSAGYALETNLIGRGNGYSLERSPFVNSKKTTACYDLQGEISSTIDNSINATFTLFNLPMEDYTMFNRNIAGKTLDNQNTGTTTWIGIVLEVEYCGYKNTYNFQASRCYTHGFPDTATTFVCQRTALLGNDNKAVMEQPASTTKTKTTTNKCNYFSMSYKDKLKNTQEEGGKCYIKNQQPEYRIFTTAVEEEKPTSLKKYLRINFNQNFPLNSACVKHTNDHMDILVDSNVVYHTISSAKDGEEARKNLEEEFSMVLDQNKKTFTETNNTITNNTITISEEEDEILDIPYFCIGQEYNSVNLTSKLRFDVALGKNVSVKTFANSLMAPFCKNYQCNRYNHSFYFSRINKCDGYTTMVLQPLVKTATS